jgi:hypothetical protein
MILDACLHCTRVNRKFKKSVFHLCPSVAKNITMSDLNSELLRAVELALAGDWDAAHQLVQQHEEDATASWIHAVPHKMEGDLSNSRYWYRRAGQLDHVDDEPRAELAAIQAELRNKK